MALEPRQLRASLAIVQTGSLGRAADTLHLTQPALSRLAKQMEKQLRVQFFERRTAAGLIRPLPCASLICERHFFVHRRRRNFLSPPLVQFLQALQQ